MRQNKVIDAIYKVADMAILSVLWVICSLPIVTIGVSTSALYYATLRGVRQNVLGGSIVRMFFDSWKTNFKQGVKWTCGLLVPIAAFAVVVYLTIQIDMGIGGMIYRFMSLWFIAALLLFALNLFPLIGRFTLKGKELFQAAFMLMSKGLGKQLLLLLFVIALQLLCAVYPPCLVLAPGIYMYCATIVLEKLFPRVLNFTDEYAEEEEGGEEAPRQEEKKKLPKDKSVI